MVVIWSRACSLFSGAKRCAVSLYNVLKYAIQRPVNRRRGQQLCHINVLRVVLYLYALLNYKCCFGVCSYIDRTDVVQCFLAVTAAWLAVVMHCFLLLPQGAANVMRNILRYSSIRTAACYTCACNNALATYISLSAIIRQLNHHSEAPAPCNHGVLVTSRIV